MDTEMSSEQTVMAKEPVSTPETPEESPEPEKSPAANGESEQMAANGNDTEHVNSTETEEAIVTESVAPTEEEADMEVEASSPAEKPDTEPTPEAAAAAPQTDESSAKSPELVADAKPEPVPVQEPVMEAEALPVAQLQELTLEDQVTAPERAEAEPPSLGEKEPQQEETNEALMETEAAAATSEGKVEEETVPAVKEAKSAESATPTEDEAKPAAAELLSPEKPTEPAAVKEEEAEPRAEEKKEAEAEKEVVSEPVTVSEAAVVAAEAPEAEEDTAPASGSLSFPLLEQAQTRDALLASRTLLVLRGLPGSGKSFLARAVADAYKDHCTVICADEHGVKPESPEASADGFKAVDEAVVAHCGAGTSLLLVVDDTNHTQERLACLAELAEQHHLVPVFLEPRTEWCRDVARLCQKSKRGLQEAQLKTMKAQMEEVSLPLYFGWFLLSAVQEKVRCTSMDFLKTLDTLEAFKKHMVEFVGKPETEVDLEQYFKPNKMLHCTTKFCDYGKAKGCKEYAQRKAVQDLYGSVFELSLTALFVTPRTVGARVSLNEEQLLLWPDDAEKESESGASLPLGSRAHVTLGCAEGVEPVQTGFDLLDILALQQAQQTGDPVVEMELGSLAYFGEGRWLLSLREPMCVPACFSSFYARKEHEPAKKETEKKKKQKCTIL